MWIPSVWILKENKPFDVYGLFEADRENEEELRDEIRIAETFSKDIKMEFGLEKCTQFR
jgi:hypothetical protein